MRTFFPTITLALLLALPAAAATPSQSLPLLLKNFSLHDFDQKISESMGYDSGSVMYLSELGSVTEAELSIRTQYEPYGCFPFYFMKEGKIVELGFNCRTFFCTGFQKGPKQCRDTDNNVYGGIVEMNNRLSALAKVPEKVLFSSFSSSQQTSEMKKAMTDLEALRCHPYYLRHYDVIVGQGYECDEVGKYPFYSPKTTCTEEWQTSNGMQCTNAQGEEELKARLEALKMSSSSTSSLPAVAPAGAKAGASSATSATSVPSTNSSTSSTTPLAFPDVLEGKYGYTAITTLANEGIIKGYPDGTFRPMMTVTRAEFTTLALLALHKNSVTNNTGCFGDVGNEWFGTFVCSAKNLGWIRGYGDGTFKPLRTMSMAEGITMLMSTLPDTSTSTQVTLPEGVDENAWYAPAVKKAIALNILREPIFDPNRIMTRADAAVWIYRAGHPSAGAVSMK